jgi:hypothetical protein
MFLKPAVEADYAEIIDLLNLAFCGSDPSASWNIEAGIIDGEGSTNHFSEKIWPQSPRHIF